MKTQKFKNLITKEQLDNSLNSEINQIHCGGLTSEEFIDKHKDLEMKKITTKPMLKVWKEFVPKFKFNKPKSFIKPYTEFLDELNEIYGEKITFGLFATMLFDVIEGEYYKSYNNNYLPISEISRTISHNQWKKLIDRVTNLISTIEDLQYGFPTE